MSEKIYKIANTLSERLSAPNAGEVCNSLSGVLFGFTSVLQNNETYVVGCVREGGEVPPGTTLLGAFFLNQCLDESAMLDQCATLTKSKKSGKFLVLCCASQKLTVLLYDIKSKKLGEANYEIVDYREVVKNSVQIVLTAVFSLNDYYRSSDAECFKSGFDQIKKALEVSQFSLSESRFCLSKENESEMLIEDLYNQIEEFDELADVQIPANMKKKIIEKNQRKLKSEKQTLKFQFANKLSASDIMDQIKLADNELVDFKFQAKIIFNVQLQNNLQYLFRLFTTSLTKVVNKFEKCIPKSIKATMLKLPKVMNFYEPSIYTHVITEVFCNLEDKEDYQAQRREVHLNYLIPLSTPTFKVVKSCESAWAKTDGRLHNVHCGLSSGIEGGQCATVSGNYAYYHYNQDQTNDSGWGCAYRSLQTIISWFHLQGYIDDQTIPTHTQIQQALVDVGDKQANFVGSSKWIGSQEVCYVLDHLYGLKSKIIFINSGEELAHKARELIQHFNTNGTPIMIGGGVLAHTIIGVHFDDATGNVKFLVLDPHFVGADDLSVIHKKGWCGWKPVTFWDKHSFYNLCLPQRPVDY